MDNIIFFISVFLAGILSFFSPCILPLLPIYAGVLLDDKDGAQASSGKFSISVVSLLRTLVFIAGISFIFILLGYGAGFYDRFLSTYPGKTICLAYQQNLSQTMLPHTAFDVAVDVVITESDVLTCT